MPWLLDELLPTFDFRTRYTRRIAASPAAVWNALEALTIEVLPVTRLLMTIRSVGRVRLSGPFVANAPMPVLATDPGREMVNGGVAQFWRLRPPAAPVPPGDAAAFAAFTRPGWAKAAMSFQLTPDGPGTVLAAETRVVATDPAARRAFARYWLLIRAGGAGFIRLELLRAVARRAEARRSH
ncbi:MAG TPA: hypothetical protein VK453_22475 [Micromonosporaceae bacterium]|nr:hypothetical protein [Micromonosporaceae bacterium]